MIRNILYSLSLHLILALMIYLNFNNHDFVEIEAEQPITVSFISPNHNPEAPISDKDVTNSKIDDKKEIKPEEKADPKKEEKKPEPKSPEPKKEEKKPEPKKEQKAQPKQEEKKEIKKAETPKDTKSPTIDKKEPKAEATKEQKPQEKKEEKKPTPKDEPKPKKDDKPEPKKEEPKKELAEKKDDKPKTQPKTQQDVGEQQNSPNNKNAQNIDKTQTINLSEREKVNVELQIKKCYKRAIRESAVANTIPVKINVKLLINGSINMSSLKIINGADFRNSPQELATAIKNTQKALQLCSPIRNLPQDKYEIWQEVELIFDPKDSR